MGTYFISDIHGEYDLFCKLLAEIDFCDSDTMIVLGDFVDKGSHPIKLAKLIASKPNIKAIQGNHEYYFLAYYHSLMKELNDGDDAEKVLKKLQDYFPEETEPNISVLYDVSVCAIANRHEKIRKKMEKFRFIC